MPHAPESSTSTELDVHRIEYFRAVADYAEIVALPARDRCGARRECLDAAGSGAGPKSERKRHGHWIGPSSAVLRSNPNAMLKHSTP